MTDAQIIEDVFGDDDLFAVPESLDAGGDVDHRTEIVESIVERYHQGWTDVNADSQRYAVLEVEPIIKFFESILYRDGGPDGVCSFSKTGHDRIADGLHDYALMGVDLFFQNVEMLFHDFECFGVSQIEIHLRGSFQIGKHDRHVPYTQAFIFRQKFLGKEFSKNGRVDYLETRQSGVGRGIIHSGVIIDRDFTNVGIDAETYLDGAVDRAGEIHLASWTGTLGFQMIQLVMVLGAAVTLGAVNIPVHIQNA